MKIVLFFLCAVNITAGSCPGRFINPLTDVCWKCLFPIKIMGITVAAGGIDAGDVRSPLCFCPKGPLPKVPGIPVSFWEPVRLVDVTRHPFCLVSMGGLQLGEGASKGDVAQDIDDLTTTSFYHVHWYIYPVLYWLELLIDLVCLEKMSIDLAYLTEFDPLWNDDAKAAILNPEAILFGNPLAQAACAADCLASSVGLSNQLLFWCAGCHGSLYPFTGNVSAHSGGVQASLLMTERMIAKLHRQFLLWGYMGIEGLCGKYPMPVIKKNQYRLQMTYPNPSECHRIGETEITWQAGREFPYSGSDFAYLIWRKRDCCLA